MSRFIVALILTIYAALLNTAQAEEINMDIGTTGPVVGFNEIVVTHYSAKAKQLQFRNKCQPPEYYPEYYQRRQQSSLRSANRCPHALGSTYCKRHYLLESLGK